MSRERRAIGGAWFLALALVGGVLVPDKAAAHDVTIEVAQTGRERLPDGAARTGARLGPVRSLDYAVALARDVRKNRPTARDIAIVLAPGLHRLESSVRLGHEDSGTAGAPLVISGSPTGNSVIRGSVAPAPLVPGRSGAGPAPDLGRLPEAARSKVQIYRLPARLDLSRRIDTARPKSLSVLVERLTPSTTPSLPFEVFDAAGAMVPARWPNIGWGAVIGPAGDGWWSFTTDAPRVAAWRGEPDLWTAGYWKFDYTYERHRVHDVVDRTLHLETPFTYGQRPGARFHVYHALAELDAPGEWYKDHATNTLIAWPRDKPAGRGPARPERLEVSIAENAFLIGGASHVRIQNLTIERFFGDGIRVFGGRDVTVVDSTIRWTGLHGASFVDSAESGIATSDISDTGEGGVLLSGGDRRTLAPAGLFVRDCRIVRFARIGYTFKPAVDIHGVGNIVAGNYIAEAPNFAVMFQGNDHLIEGNEITDVVSDTSDAGALYSSHDWTARGTIIRGNFLHDIKGRQPGFETKGVYLDDYTSGIAVRGNLFLRVEKPVFIGGGRDNLIEGNVFIASPPAVHIDSRGIDWSAKFVTNPASGLRTRLTDVPFESEPWRTRYPRLPTLLADEPGEAKRNITRNNVIIGGPAYVFETKAVPRKQTLGPDFGAGTIASPVKAAAVPATEQAKTAAEVGTLIAADLATASGPTLPFAIMDRTARAGRPPPQRLR